MKTVLLFLLCILHMSAMAELRVVVISDLNGSYGSTEYRREVDAAVQRILTLKPDLVISTGDMIAGQRPSPLLSKMTLQSMWATFHQRVSLPLKSQGVPLAVTPGNHDASVYGRYHLEREVFVDTWRLFRPDLDFVDDAHYPLYYAFSKEDVLFISLDVTGNGPLDPRQKTWLRELLEDRGAQDSHRVVFSHLPLWPVAQKRETAAMFDEELETILKEGKVDLYLSGHHHAYYPGYKNGIRYVSQACLGAGPRRLLGDEALSPRSITLVGLKPEEPARVRALTGRNFDEFLDIQTLPEKIVGERATLIRMDLAPEAGGLP